MTPQHILVPTDFSPDADQALADAMTLAKTLQARLTVLHVIHIPTDPGESVGMLSVYLETVAKEVDEQKKEVLKRLHDAGLQGDVEVVYGVPFQTIVETARDQHVDLIVMGTHGRTGLKHIVIGSVAERVARLAPCPVWVTRPHKASFTPHFLIPLDFSPDAAEALTYAMILARPHHARLTLLHVIDQPSIGVGQASLAGTDHPEVLVAVEQGLANALRRVRQAGLKGTTTVARGNPLQHILDVAQTQHADLIVIGTHGRTGFKRVLLGSVAENVLRLAPCPVLVTHQPEEAPMSNDWH